MKSISLKMKLGLAFASLLLIISAMGIMNYNPTHKLSDLADEVDKQMYKKQLSTELDEGMELQTSATRGFVLSGRDSILQRREEGITRSDRVMEELKKLLQTQRSYSRLLCAVPLSGSRLTVQAPSVTGFEFTLNSNLRPGIRLKRFQ